MLRHIKFLIGLLLVVLSLLSLANSQLTANFYDQTCPNLVSIVNSTFQSLAAIDNVVAPSTLRLSNHDCFVQGCDASIMILSTPGNQAERDAPDNANMPTNAFDTINKLKHAVESVCPGVVSCADIIALAARDSVVFSGGPSWEVPLGRRDGLVSQATLVEGQLPKSNFDFAQLASNFASKGLNTVDLAVLSAAHTIGFSNCNEFTFRLYNFSPTQRVDPTMDPAYVQKLQSKCPANGTGGPQPFDPVTPFRFDNSYYQDILDGKGLLFTDQVLLTDNSTRDLINLFAASPDLFFQYFPASMVRMSSIGVITGNMGEIRRDCTSFNAVPNLQTDQVGT